ASRLHPATTGCSTPAPGFIGLLLALLPQPGRLLSLCQELPGGMVASIPSAQSISQQAGCLHMKNMHKTHAAHTIGASSASDSRIVLNRAGSRGRVPFALAALASLLSLGACVTMPTGPSMMALPGVGKNFDEFRYDDSLCRQ